MSRICAARLRWLAFDWRRAKTHIRRFPARVVEYGERGRIRTCDPCLKRALLYQLSYAPILVSIVYHWPCGIRGCRQSTRDRMPAAPVK
jgi:hypothetical protein